MNVAGARVFVVDDDRSMLRAVARRPLRMAGHEVETFASPGEFLARPPHDGPGCVLLDLQECPGSTVSKCSRPWPVAGQVLPVFRERPRQRPRHGDGDEGRSDRLPDEAVR